MVSARVDGMQPPDLMRYLESFVQEYGPTGLSARALPQVPYVQRLMANKTPHLTPFMSTIAMSVFQAEGMCLYASILSATRLSCDTFHLSCSPRVLH